MNFYEHQDRARKRTKVIVLLFIVAVIIIMGVIVVPVGLASEWNGGAIAIASVCCLLIVGISTLVKLGQLNDGGRVVAEMLGGTELQTSGRNKAEQKVKNIVEEMAIASGMPVPSIFIIEDNSINAFAAGWTPSDAVIGVTRGCIEQLNRDELQGVIAHEFSHISHGDMRINIRLIGVIFGIMAIGITGWIFARYIGPIILRSSSRSRSKEGAGGAGIGLAVIVFGLFLVVCGFVGTFFDGSYKLPFQDSESFWLTHLRCNTQETQMVLEVRFGKLVESHNNLHFQKMVDSVIICFSHKPCVLFSPAIRQQPRE